MTNMYFSICGLFCIVLLLIIFLSKERIKSAETKLYGFMLISSFFDVVLVLIEISFGYMNLETLPITLLKILNKIDFIHYIIWPTLMFLYIFYITYKDDKKYKKIKNVLIFLDIIFVLVEFCLPINIINESNGAMGVSGIGTNVVYGFSTLYFSMIILVLLFNLKKTFTKKYIPFIALFIFMILAMYVRSVSPTLIVLPAIIIYIDLIMYFTIENPDVKMIEQLNIAKEDAEKANRAKTDFLSSMSHEIRTPLNAIVGFSECLLQAEDLPEAKENAEDIVGASKTLLEIVNGILDISKIEAGKIEIHNSSYKPNELFSEIERLIRARLGEKELEFRVSIAPDIPEVLYGDHSNIKKVIINLLTNALKYTDQGYFTFEVKCINKNNICRLMIDVKDTGRGIKKQDLDKLFTKFQRLDEDRNTTIEGTGLGLAITKQLVEIMGGKIIVQSQYGEGSKFSVILDQQISNENINSENVIVVDNLDLSGKKILVVDDNKLNIKVASKILSKYNLNIDSAESGMECLEKIKNGSSYDIIFMDDMMPRMNGGETLLRLKQIEGFKTPIIALTANAINGMKEKYLNQGFNDYLSKPIEKDELHQVLCKYLRDSKEEKNEIEKEEIVYKDYSNKKVLIVDDNKMNIKVASHIMKPYNFEIDEALSGEECLNIIKNKEYDLIFMDYMMPDMDGIETLKNLKKIEGFKTPVIALTADAVVGAREKFLKAGFDEYVSKPIIKESLNKAIDNVLNKN